MNLDGQSFVALLLVAAAAVYLVARLFRHRGAGCTGCETKGCSSAAPPLVQLTHDGQSNGTPGK